MPAKAYSRTLLLIGGGSAVVAVNYWLVTTGHYRLPLLVFAGFFVFTWLSFRKLPPSTTNRNETEKNLLKLSSRLRRLGLIGAAGFALFILTSSRTDFKGMSTLGIVGLYLWGAFVVSCYLWGARWSRRKANALPVGATEGEKPIHDQP